MKIASKQVSRIFAGSIKVTNMSVNSGNSSVVATSAVTTALTTAGDNSTAVPLVASSGPSVVGVIVTAPLNLVKIWDTTTKMVLSSSAGTEVYGKLTNSGSVYTISFYYLDGAGVEQAHTFSSNQAFDFDFCYRYKFEQIPADFAIAQIVRNIDLDLGGAGTTPFIEILTVTGTNIVSNLSQTPNTSYPILLIVNGLSEPNVGVNASFSVAGVVITWNAANAGYSLATTDVVYAQYYI